MGKQVSFFAMVFLMLVIFYGLIRFIFDMSGWKFYIELILLLALLLSAFFSLILIYNRLNTAYVMLALVSLISLLNLVLIYFRTYMSTLMFAAMVSSITAFVLCIVNIKGKKKHVKMAKEKTTDKKSVLKTYTPGKVVASKNAKYYHAPKCDWAKKIKKSNMVWFDTDHDAKKKGLKAHTCLK